MSIAIPTFEYYDRGVEMLDDIFRTIEFQTLDMIQVVVSDHSKNNNIKEFCQENIYNLNIKYVRNEKDRGNAGSNTNSAINNCDGEIIKVIQQDDFLYTPDALKKIYDLMSGSEEQWLVCGAIHTDDDGESFYRPMFPRWDDRMILYSENNYIGGVSVVAINKNVVTRFDPNVRMLLDIDFYFNLKAKYGNPIYCKEILVGNRVRSYDTLAAEVSENDVEEEFKYFHKKIGIDNLC
jgi:glycosyltransferase involved in cell wall biosynthesis